MLLHKRFILNIVLNNRTSWGGGLSHILFKFRIDFIRLSNSNVDRLFKNHTIFNHYACGGFSMVSNIIIWYNL